jgi:hypothetical protein
MERLSCLSVPNSSKTSVRHRVKDRFLAYFVEEQSCYNEG